MENIGKDIKNVYTILNDCVDRELKRGEFITKENMREIEQYNNSLLVAPAGAGKTTAIVNLAMEKDGVKRALMVPTIAIAEQLYVKYGDNDDFKVYFLFTKNKKRHENTFHIDDADLVVMTFDQFKHIENNFEYVLYIDEAHEFHSFKNISSTKREINIKIQNSKHKKIFITATPMNLADNFDFKIKYKGHLNKNVTFLNAENSFSGAIVEHILVKAGNGKTLAYVNSKKKMAQIKKHIEENSGYNVACIFSGCESAAYEQLMNNDKDSLNADIVLCTKILNIGFDINNIFDEVVYATEGTNTNAILQFINRERQRANFTIISKNESNSNKFLKLNKVVENKENDLLTDIEKTIFNNAHVLIDGKIFYDENAICEQKNNFVQFSNDELIGLMDEFYINTNDVSFNKIVTNTEARIFTNDGAKGAEAIDHLIFKEGIDNIFAAYYDDNLDLLMREYDLSTKSRIDTYFMTKYIISKLSYIENSNNLTLDTMSSKNAKVLKNIFKGDNIVRSGNLQKRMICRDEDNAIANALFNAVSNELIEDDRDVLIDELNGEGGLLLRNGKKWDERNFKANIEFITGLRLKSKKKSIKGNKIRVYNDDTFLIEEAVQDFEGYDLWFDANGKILKDVDVFSN